MVIKVFRIEMIVLVIAVALLSQFQTNGFPRSEEDTEAPIKYPIPYEGSGVEGDMFFPDMLQGRGVAQRGNTVHWTNGIVPYEFLPGFAYSQETLIVEMMRYMESRLAINGNMCVYFRPKNATDRYYITIRNAAGCSSYVGQNTGLNLTRYVSLQHPGCVYEGVIMHELIHALGFQHEQSRPDRDNYLRINLTNVKPGYEYNFNKLSNTSVDTLNTSYDYYSVMHYGGTAFSSNGFATMEALQPNVTVGGNNLTETDIYELRTFYNCSASITPLPIPANHTLPDIYVINTTLSSALTTNDPLFRRYLTPYLNYYYQVFSIIVPVAGYYSIMSVGTTDVYGLLHYPTFNASVYGYNVINNDDNSAGNLQFQMIMHFPANTEYILVVTTTYRNKTGPFTIVISGLNSANIKRVYETQSTNTTTSGDDNNMKQTIIIIVAAVTGGVLIIVLIALALQLLCSAKRKPKIGVSKRS